MKIRCFAMALIGAAALFAAGCANDEANSTAASETTCSADKACTSGDKAGCCKDKAAGECCQKKDAAKTQ